MAEENKPFVNKLMEMTDKRKQEMFEEHERLKKIYDQAYHDYQQLLIAVFNNDNGKKLLDAWEKYYFYRPLFPPKHETEATEFEPQHREGENRFLRKLLTDLKLAEQQKG